MPSATLKPPYLHNVSQEEPNRGVTSAEEGTAPAVHAVTQFTKTYRIRKTGDGWWLDKNDGTDEALLTDQTRYTPDFRVRSMSVKDTDTTGVMVVFDEPRSEGVVERFIFGIDRPFHVTRIHIGSAAMTATDINLHG